MAIDKSELKMAVAHELGAGFDDALERAAADTNKWVGAKTALGDAATAIEKLLAHISQDVKDEDMTIEQSTAAQKYVRRAAEICRNLKLKAEIHEQRAHGRVEALGTVIKVTKNLFEKEKSKVEALKAHAETEDEEPDAEVSRRPTGRPTGARPPNVIGAKKIADKAE